MANKSASIKMKIILIVFIGFIISGGIIGFLFLGDIGRLSKKSIEEMSHTVLITAEAAREEMADKIEQGILRPFDDLVAQGSREQILAAVPIITAMNVARKGAADGNYEFRVPKIEPRNPENTPTALELAVLEELKEEELPMKMVVSRENIRIFHPIRLTEECMLCHGEPAGSPDPIGGIKEGWKVGEIHGAFEVISSLAPARKEQQRALLEVAAGSLGIALLLVFFLWLAIRGILKPLNDYIGNFKLAATGDLRIRAVSKNSDEVGVLSGYFNEFIDSLKSMIVRVKEVTDDTREVSGDLAATSEETASALVEMRVNTENMKDKIVHLDDEVNSSTRAAISVKEFITKVGDSISSQAAAVDESSASIEEISSSIVNIAKAAEEKLKIANALEKTAMEGETEMEETVKIIKRVAESANVIMNSISVIQNIASQTNLLAMNAAIEAAHAGDAGRGFAVVADEIRKLAESSSESAKVITQSLKVVTGDIQVSEESTVKSGRAFNGIVGSVKDVAAAMEEMKNATDELSLGSQQIVEALSSLVTISEEVKTSYAEMDEAVEGITGSMNELSTISADTKNGMEEVSIGINEVYQAAQIISDSGTKNSENVAKLEELMAEFKVDEENESHPASSGLREDQESGDAEGTGTTDGKNDF